MSLLAPGLCSDVLLAVWLWGTAGDQLLRKGLCAPVAEGQALGWGRARVPGARKLWALSQLGQGVWSP